LEAEYDRLGFKLDVEPIAAVVQAEEQKLEFTEEVDETVTAVKSSSKRRTTGGSKKRGRRASEDDSALPAATPSAKAPKVTSAPATEPAKRSEPLGTVLCTSACFYHHEGVAEGCCCVFVWCVVPCAETVVERSTVVETTVTRSVPQFDNGVGMEVDLIAERVDITNNTDGPLNLSGYKLSSVVGDQGFTFGEDCVLDRGETVTVWSGPQSSKHKDPPRHLQWTRRYIWNNEGDTAVLFDGEGAVVQKVVCTPVAASEALNTVRAVVNGNAIAIRWCFRRFFFGLGFGLRAWVAVVTCTHSV
jgi:hypothetical protein